jgi:hypothetical protein
VQLPSAQRVGEKEWQPGTAVHAAAVLPQLPSTHSTPTPHAAAAAMQFAAELVQVPSAQRTWFGGPHESSAEHSAMVARHCSLPSGPHRIGRPAAHGQLASSRWPLDEHCGSEGLATKRNIARNAQSPLVTLYKIR